MSGSIRARFRPHERLHSGVDFQRVLKRGIRLNGRLFTLVAASSPGAFARLGLAVGRRLGGAAARNRVKRLLRESFRRNKTALPGPVDLVLIAKAETRSCGSAEIEREYRKRLERLGRQRTDPSREPSTSGRP